MSRPISRGVLVLIIAAGMLLTGALGALGALYVQAQAYRETVQEVCADKAAEGGRECTPQQLKGEPGAKGDPGKDGADGRGVVDQQCIDGVWHVYYSDNVNDYDAGPCTGTAGADGKDGKPGQDGEDGVGSPGPTGPPGTDGKDGADGRGVSDQQCEQNDDGTWTWHVYYTDETVDTAAGPCYSPGLLD